MKTLKLYAFLGTVAAVIIFSGCTKDDDQELSFYNASSKQPSENLSGQELQGLIYIVEIQKLQRDIYMALDERNINPIFNELYLADAKSLDEISATIEAYGQENPVLDRNVGDFRRTEVQALYDEFTYTVNNNLIEMLTFAVRMEEGTVDDISEFMEQVDGNEDIRQLYTDLLTGSYIQLNALNDEIKKTRTGIMPMPEADKN